MKCFKAMLLVMPVALAQSPCWMWRPPDCPLEVTLDGEALGLHFDGHGAMSARGASRLLFDYPEPARSEILDYLFLPKFGASLQVLKVGVGADTQSGYGVEPSHMHEPNDLACDRVMTFWLVREARLRNPKLVVYALPHAYPYWVGVHDNSQTVFHNSDAIQYLVNWVECANSTGAGTINYIGNRHNPPLRKMPGDASDGELRQDMITSPAVLLHGQNRQHWGPASWSVELRLALDAAGFTATRLVLPDSPYDPSVRTMIESDQSFADSMEGGAIGIHYPCHLPMPDLRPSTGLPLWSSEDINEDSNWVGASCLGRTLNTNFLRMNITSTILRTMARSMNSMLAPQKPSKRSADGLIDAFEPWTGSYAVRDPLWMLAHTTQFTEIGWQILTYQAGGAGPLKKGGTFVTYMSPERDEFTLVVEKLHGRCRNCDGSTTGPETVTFTLVGKLIPWDFTEHMLNDSNISNDTEPDASNNVSNASQLSDGYQMAIDNDTDETETASNTILDERATENGSNGTENNETNLTDLADTADNNETNLTENVNGHAVWQHNVSLWLSNKTHKFIQMPPLLLDLKTASFKLTILPDHIYTVSSLHGQLHGEPNAGSNDQEVDPGKDSSWAASRFPIPYQDTFDKYEINDTPRFFSDYGGSFQVAVDPTNSPNLVLKQWVRHPSAGNRWTTDSEPISLTADKLVDVALTVDVFLPSPSSPQPDTPGNRSFYIRAAWAGQCIVHSNAASWDGAKVSQRSCEAGWEEQFRHDEETGRIFTSGAAQQCITAHMCSTSPFRDPDICTRPCHPTGSLEHSNQSWAWHDGSLRLRGRPELCLTSTSKGQAQRVLQLLPCKPNSPDQLWEASAELEVYAGACLRLEPVPSPTDEDAGEMLRGRRGRSGYCLRLGVNKNNDASWLLEAGGKHATILASGPLTSPLGAWHSLRLEATGTVIVAQIDGQKEVRAVNSDHRFGAAALISGWNVAYFDNFEIEASS